MAGRRAQRSAGGSLWRVRRGLGEGDGNAGGAVLFGIEEQPRTYRATNPYSYSFDGTAWYLVDPEGAQPVLTVQWRAGQRAVFGYYLEAPEYPMRLAYFVYDEQSGQLIQGFDASGAWIGAILPRRNSLFLPFRLTPDFEVVEEIEPVSGLETTLQRTPLPPGEYLISVTGFDLGSNSAAAGTVVTVAPTVATCEPSTAEWAASAGPHDLRLALDPGESVTLVLFLDRNPVGRVRYTVDVPLGLNAALHVELVGPDGQTISAGGPTRRAADAFQPLLSGPYTLTLANPLSAQATVLLSWTVFPRPEPRLPAAIDLDRYPGQLDLLERPGLHVATLTVPARQSLTPAARPLRSPRSCTSWPAGARATTARSSPYPPAMWCAW